MVPNILAHKDTTRESAEIERKLPARKSHGIARDGMGLQVVWLPRATLNYWVPLLFSMNV